MFSSFLAAPCEVKLHLLQHVVYLRPPTRRPTEDALPTATDEVARGLVELHVPHDRRIGGIRVKLRAVQSVAILPDQRDMVNFAGATPVGWEDTILMEKVVEIGLPPEKSHATVPGDDSISSSAADRRGRSRQARSNQNSRMVTPVQSRTTSPRISLEDAPPEYQERETASSSNTPREVHSQDQINSTSIGSIMRAFSRGRPSSRPSSQTGSRSVSRSVSRAASRDPSPTRATDSPRLTPSHSNTSPLALEQEAEIDTLNGHMSRTGLSRGRDQASGAHPHANDNEDYFGILGTNNRRGRSHLAPTSNSNSTPSSSAINHRSITLSPSRGVGTSRRRDESRVRFPGIGKRGVRAPSVDTGARSSASSSDEQDGLFLQKGVHGFEFAFIIPADSPPYERSPYGRVRYVVKATAFGAGRAKSNIEAWRDMFPVVNPSTDGGPVPLTVLYNDLHPTVGLLSIACTANNVSVGGIFNVDIHSPTPPPDLMVYLVRVSVETTTELRTRKRGKQYVPTQRHKLFEKGWVPPRPNDPHGQGDGKRSEGLIRDPTRPGSRPDDAWTVQGIARMPNDNIVRSTTISGTRAAIRFSHQLLVEVVHSLKPEVEGQERKLKVFALRQPITLPSCCVAYDAVILPAYTPNDGTSRPVDMPYDVNAGDESISHSSHQADATQGESSRRGAAAHASTSSRVLGPSHEFCVCGQTLRDLSEREQAMIPARSYADLPLDGLSHRKIGELPTSQGGYSIGSTLRRSTSRSSSTSRESRERSTSRHSLSLRRGLSRNRSPSVGSTISRNGRRSSVTRANIGAGLSVSANRGESSSNGIYANGAGERGEGIIRTSRSVDTPAVPPMPPSYEHVVEEDSAEEDVSENEERPNTAAIERTNGQQVTLSIDQSGIRSSAASSSTHSAAESSLSSGAAADDESKVEVVEI